MIYNPILPGFHPDPSIVRVGGDYYIATSTFEWFPGVRLHHSTDLAHWRPLGGALTQRRLLDLTGVGDSCGVWAPDLTHHEGTFYLVYSNMDSSMGEFMDPHNYLSIATDIAGPWSDPVPLHARGFDAALFHDDDASTWLLSMSVDWRPGREWFAGIQIQRYDRDARALVGPRQTIFRGTAAGLTEGPHLYRRDGWYYLVTAEGGTEWAHQVTVARSRSLFGPYEPDPAGPMLTSAGRPDLRLQKAGHGSLVQAPDGQWYLAHLAARPYSPLGPCVLGRETALQVVQWPEGGWPRVEGGVPAERLALPGAAAPPDAVEVCDDFDEPVLGPDWSTLRRPATTDWLDLAARPSYLRVHGGQSPGGRRRPSLVARRVTDPHCRLETELEFRPADFRQLAGVTAYYNTRNWHFAYVTADDDGRPVLQVLTCDAGRKTLHAGCDVDASGADRLGLRVTLDGPAVRFAYRLGGDWTDFPVVLDATILSDEHASAEPEKWGFTGAFVGLWVLDMGADGCHADFAHATYAESPG